MNPRATELAADRLRRTDQFFLHSSAVAGITLAATAIAALWARGVAIPLAALSAIEGLVVMWARYTRRDLVQTLALESHAAHLPPVEEYRARIIAQPARDRLAGSIKSLIAEAHLPYTFCLADRVALVEDQLRLLARELATPEVSFQPRSSITCLRLLTHGVESPLFNPGLPVEQLHATLLRIRFGIDSAAG